MPMLYDVFYFDAKTGRRLAGFDRDTSGCKAAPKGLLARVCNTNWDGHTVWVDDRGREIPTPDFALDDMSWVERHLGEARFADPSHAAAVRDAVDRCREDIQARHRYAPEFASLRAKMSRGETIMLHLTTSWGTTNAVASRDLLRSRG
jgi:hypothetical protein